MNFKTTITEGKILTNDTKVIHGLDKVENENINEDSEIESSVKNFDEDVSEIIDLEEEESKFDNSDKKNENITSIINDNEEETSGINNQEDENICKTKECIEVSNELLNSIDPSIDPCEDFYQFTCGNWMKNNPTDEELIVKNFDKEYNNVKNNLMTLIQSDYQPNKNLSKQDQELDKIIFNKLSGFYKSCMDIDKVNENGIKSLINLIDKLNIRDIRDKFNDIDELSKIVSKIHDYKITEKILFSSDINFGNDKKTKYISFSEGSYTEFEEDDTEKAFLKIYEN
ncbi:hypothetical protein PIROE2DRAFT_60217 [Piromyces sp. E2]|nr:hypothetical protein PIROE2DRAFT_60217 [Piromyces sp. E2]|eukprot:OUM65174.1 hypothetical protein PIROE2DRAFT_60217 [Piromyces sp. E2]